MTYRSIRYHEDCAHKKHFKGFCVYPIANDCANYTRTNLQQKALSKEGPFYVLRPHVMSQGQSVKVAQTVFQWRFDL